MKTILSATALATVALMTAGAAHAETAGSDWLPWNWVRGDETYVSAKGAYSFAPQDSGLGGSNSVSFEQGWGANVAVGKYLNPNIRAEIEAGYYTNEADSIDIGSQSRGAHGDATAWTGMLNAYYEPFANCRVKPYIGAGVGIANIDFDGVRNSARTYADDSDTNFAYQGMAGASYQLTPSTALTAEYRYVGSTGLDVGAAKNVDYNNHLATAGVRFKF